MEELRFLHTKLDTVALSLLFLNNSVILGLRSLLVLVPAGMAKTVVKDHTSNLALLFLKYLHPNHKICKSRERLLKAIAIYFTIVNC